MSMSTKSAAILIAIVGIFLSYATGQATAIPGTRQVDPDTLVKLLQSSDKEKPLILHIGFRVLFLQAHIPGSEYIGPGSTEAGLQQLRKRVAAIPRSKFIVLYCGCCPWIHCPNMKGADDTLTSLGFKNVKVLYIADNFGTDWVDKGYPVAKGE